jgi:hypothetical protein
MNFSQKYKSWYEYRGTAGTGEEYNHLGENGQNYALPMVCEAQNRAGKQKPVIHEVLDKNSN